MISEGLQYFFFYSTVEFILFSVIVPIKIRKLARAPPWYYYTHTNLVMLQRRRSKPDTNLDYLFILIKIATNLYKIGSSSHLSYL